MMSYQYTGSAGGAACDQTTQMIIPMVGEPGSARAESTNFRISGFWEFKFSRSLEI